MIHESLKAQKQITANHNDFHHKVPMKELHTLFKSVKNLFHLKTASLHCDSPSSSQSFSSQLASLHDNYHHNFYLSTTFFLHPRYS